MTVYVMGCKGSRLVKIGHSKDPAKRLKEVSGMSPQVVKLLWQSTPNYGEIDERKLHKIFRDYRRRGEWFDFGDVDPVALISVAIDLPLPVLEHPVGTTPGGPRVNRLKTKRVAPDTSLLTVDPLTPAAQAALPNGYAVGEEFGQPCIGAWD